MMSNFLANNKISNVVQTNLELEEDRRDACQKIEVLVEQLKQEVVSGELPQQFGNSTKNLRDLFKSFKSTLKTNQSPKSGSSEQLCQSIEQLSALIEALKTKSQIVEEENAFYRAELKSLTLEYTALV